MGSDETYGVFSLVVAAASEGKSINQWVVEALTGSIEHRP
ncbi:toxin-antitoxin system HicB family antitoxin [Gilvimarinus japonicus]|uniref:Toxin-antitoxin system HicB family antitoxin n=1 Tax=Gilvimarinus japonicus TaxID=1796469 RepID=A0ABV7HVP0_9GAMM